MSVVVIGLNHRTMPLDKFERMAIPPEQLPKALAAVHHAEDVTEAVVLSTCNRTEVYAVAEKFHGAYQDIRNVLGDLAHVAPEEFSDHLYVHYDEGAVRHLFSVACGLDSVVVGEHEILGQVKSAWEVSQQEGRCGPLLNLLFRSAVSCGKRARTETDIGRHIASMSQAAVAMAAERLGGLEGRTVLVLGAGDMGEGMALTLSKSGVTEVLVANRTFDRAVELASRVGGRPLRLAELPPVLSTVDVLLTSTGATSLIVDHTELAPLIEQRQGRPLMIVDIAVPRDVDPHVGSLPGVTLLDLDDLRRFAEDGIRARRREVVAVQRIIEDDLERYHRATSARTVAPLISELHAVAERLRLAELDRYRSPLADLDAQQREAVDALTKGLMAKVLHGPTVRLKDLAGSPRGERLADALRDLYELYDEDGAAVPDVDTESSSAPPVDPE